MCVVYWTRPSYVCDVQDQTLVLVWCTGPPSCVRCMWTRHMYIVYHDCVRVGILCIKITPPLHARGGLHTQGPYVPACLFLFLPSPRLPPGCTSLLVCTEDVGSMSLLRAACRCFNSLPGVLHTRTFTVAISVCCILHIIQCMYVCTLYYLQTMHALLYILHAVFSECVQYQAN